MLNKTSAVGESETQARSSIVVEGLRKNFQEKDAEVMKKYFENVNKSNGGSIAQITFDGEKRVIHITFEEDGGMCFFLSAFLYLWERDVAPW